MNSPTDNPDRLLNREYNPYLAPEHRDDPVAVPERFHARRIFLVLVGVKILTIVGGAIAAIVDIESIVFSGPVISLLGLPIAFLAYRVRHWRGVWFGLSGPAITLFCFALINIQNWGPGDAQGPVSVITSLYAAVAVVLGVLAFLLPEDSAVEPGLRGMPNRGIPTDVRESE